MDKKSILPGAFRKTVLRQAFNQKASRSAIIDMPTRWTTIANAPTHGTAVKPREGIGVLAPLTMHASPHRPWYGYSGTASHGPQS